MEKKTKNRGCNYTEYKKGLISEIIKKYISIIENKETNAHMILRKRKTWQIITEQFNTVAVSGQRTWIQLRQWYENQKQRTRKNVAIDNVTHFYLHRKKYLDKENKKEEIQELKKKASDDKKAIILTGGGGYRIILKDSDQKILALIAKQVRTLENPYDDAALYFGEEEIPLPQDFNEPDQHINEDIMIEAEINNDEIEAKPTPDIVNSEVTVKTTEVVQLLETPTCRKKLTKTNTKETYFKTKLFNAKLEKKYLINKNQMAINKNKMEIEKHRIEMEILQLKLKKMRK